MIRATSAPAGAALPALSKDARLPHRPRKRRSPNPRPAPQSQGPAAGRARKSPAANATQVGLRPVAAADGAWELVHPRCAREREEDLAEVQGMLDAGELDVAEDELRWLLEGCPDLILAHRLLGEIALERGNMDLARGHFGYAYRVGTKTLPDGFRGTLPYSQPANQAFLESAKGLAFALRQLNKPEMAKEVVATLLRLDPADPLGATAWRE